MAAGNLKAGQCIQYKFACNHAVNQAVQAIYQECLLAGLASQLT